MTSTALARIALGSIFLTFGLNGFYTFIPVPEFSPFMAILVSSGYIYVVKTVEVVCGLLLLANRYVPLALVLLGPDVANIVAYHVLLDHRNWPIAIVNVTIFVFLLHAYKPCFTPLLVQHADEQDSTEQEP